MSDKVSVRQEIQKVLEIAREMDNEIISQASKILKLEAENALLRGKIEDAKNCLEGEPEYHSQGMGCGLEDRGITDRYDAMEYGWDKDMKRVYGENFALAKHGQRMR